MSKQKQAKIFDDNSYLEYPMIPLENDNSYLGHDGVHT